MNGEVCCILGVCCPPGSDAQTVALRDAMERDGVTDAASAAVWVLKTFDLAPHGSLTQFKADVAKMARRAGV